MEKGDRPIRTQICGTTQKFIVEFLDAEGQRGQEHYDEIFVSVVVPRGKFPGALLILGKVADKSIYEIFQESTWKTVSQVEKLLAEAQLRFSVDTAISSGLPEDEAYLNLIQRANDISSRWVWRAAKLGDDLDASMALVFELLAQPGSVVMPADGQLAIDIASYEADEPEPAMLMAFRFICSEIDLSPPPVMARPRRRRRFAHLNRPNEELVDRGGSPFERV
jgi:hypothetical protein